MLQFPAMMRRFPSPTVTPSSVMIPLPPSPQSDELLLAVEEAELEDRLGEIRKLNSNLTVIGKPSAEFKEDLEADADEDDGDNVDESDGDEFEQEAG